MLEICLTCRATPISARLSFRVYFSRITRQTAAGGQLCAKRHVPNYRISIAVEQADAGFNPLVKKKKNPTRLSDRTVCSGWKHPYPRIPLWSLAAEAALQLQHRDPWDSSQTRHVTSAPWCRRPTQSTSKWLSPSDCKIATWKYLPHTPSPSSRREDKVHHSRQGTISTNNSRFKNCSASQNCIGLLNL